MKRFLLLLLSLHFALQSYTYSYFNIKWIKDVRTAEEYADGHIENTLNIDVLKDDFQEKALITLPKDKTIAVNCRSGKRSKNAAKILVKNGYKVIELDEGYNGWVSKGMPVTKQYSSFQTFLP